MINKIITGLHCLVAMVFLMGCGGDLTYQEALERNKNKIDDPQRVNDAEFLVEIKSLNILETMLTEKAADSGYAASVVSMAKINLEDHKELNKNLKELARKENIALPSSMSKKHQGIFDELSQTSRQNFDTDFIQIIKNVNEENNESFTSKATSANDPDIRAFAARKLDMIRLHAERISNVEKELLRTY